MSNPPAKKQIEVITISDSDDDKDGLPPSGHHRKQLCVKKRRTESRPMYTSFLDVPLQSENPKLSKQESVDDDDDDLVELIDEGSAREKSMKQPVASKPMTKSASGESLEEGEIVDDGDSHLSVPETRTLDLVHDPALEDVSGDSMNDAEETTNAVGSRSNTPAKSKPDVLHDLDLQSISGDGCLDDDFPELDFSFECSVDESADDSVDAHMTTTILTGKVPTTDNAVVIGGDMWENVAKVIQDAAKEPVVDQGVKKPDQGMNSDFDMLNGVTGQMQAPVFVRDPSPEPDIIVLGVVDGSKKEPQSKDIKSEGVTTNEAVDVWAQERSFSLLDGLEHLEALAEEEQAMDVDREVDVESDDLFIGLFGPKQEENQVVSTECNEDVVNYDDYAEQPFLNFESDTMEVDSNKAMSLPDIDSPDCNAKENRTSLTFDEAAGNSPRVDDNSEQVNRVSTLQAVGVIPDEMESDNDAATELSPKKDAESEKIDFIERAKAIYERERLRIDRDDEDEGSLAGFIVDNEEDATDPALKPKLKWFGPIFTDPTFEKFNDILNAKAHLYSMSTCYATKPDLEHDFGKLINSKQVPEMLKGQSKNSIYKAIYEYIQETKKLQHAKMYYAFFAQFDGNKDDGQLAYMCGVTNEKPDSFEDSLSTPVKRLRDLALVTPPRQLKKRHIEASSDALDVSNDNDMEHHEKSKVLKSSPKTQSADIRKFFKPPQSPEVITID